LGALAGAFAGAVAAQRTAERNKSREELLREIRNTNAAIILAGGVCNVLLALKSQHVKRLKESYDAQQTELLEFERKKNAGELQRNVSFLYEPNLNTFQQGPISMDTLRTIIFERLSIVGRPLCLLETLFQTVQNLEKSLAKRNTLIEGYKNTEINKQDLSLLYFGRPNGRGDVNCLYPDTIDAIYRQTEDGIESSYLIYKDLHEYGKQLSDTFKKKFRTDSPQISKFDIPPAVVGLMPDETNYADWIKF
jgi:hypothetical protein